jgi:hypothetical protein
MPYEDFFLGPMQERTILQKLSQIQACTDGSKKQEEDSPKRVPPGHSSPWVEPLG